jgi:NAD(P)-dependent dehydrogenase (short-subunit alcohol dehydrogenase family)
MRLEGKVAFVTGASRGTGTEICRRALKAGVIGMTRSLARAVAKDGIRVNCAMPGAIRTDHEIESADSDADSSAARMAARQSLPGRGAAADLVATFLYWHPVTATVSRVTW